MYRLKNGSTFRVSTNADASYVSLRRTNAEVATCQPTQELVKRVFAPVPAQHARRSPTAQPRGTTRSLASEGCSSQLQTNDAVMPGVDHID